jgi:hypothetical protein
VRQPFRAKRKGALPMSNLLKLVDWLSFQKVTEYLKVSLPSFQIKDSHLLAVIEQKHLPLYFYDNPRSGIFYVEFSAVDTIVATILCAKNNSTETKNTIFMGITEKIIDVEEKIWAIDMFEEYLKIDLEKSYPPISVLFDTEAIMDIDATCFPAFVMPPPR